MTATVSGHRLRVTGSAGPETTKWARRGIFIGGAVKQ
jgi:hypothetical protein